VKSTTSHIGNQHQILFFTYWYPHKSNSNFAIFVKRHASSIALLNKVVVLSFHITRSDKLFRMTSTSSTDDQNMITHQITVETRFNKMFYLLLPLHYIILKKYIKRHILTQQRFDTIHSNITFPCAIVGYWLSKAFKSRHVITEHWSKLDKFFRANLYRWYGKKALNKADAITCVSETLLQTVKRYTSNKNIHVVPNVIDSSQFFYDPAVQKNDVYTCIAIAHWAEPKNPFYFLDALQDLVSEGRIKKPNMVLIGTGHLIETIKAKNYLFEIDYKGNLAAAGINTELNKSHLFVHGSDFETFSVVIAEALLSGTPAVTSPVGIAGEVINSTNGFVTDNTKNDWKQKILAAYHMPFDRLHISLQLKDTYSPSAVSTMFAQVYQHIESNAH
jgi:glycosyltransferase involved in cell wall biosynthesis